jgi:hypothetical protein
MEFAKVHIYALREFWPRTHRPELTALPHPEAGRALVLSATFPMLEGSSDRIDHSAAAAKSGTLANF